MLISPEIYFTYSFSHYTEIFCCCPVSDCFLWKNIFCVSRDALIETVFSFQNRVKGKPPVFEKWIWKDKHNVRLSFEAWWKTAGLLFDIEIINLYDFCSEGYLIILHLKWAVAQIRVISLFDFFFSYDEYESTWISAYMKKVNCFLIPLYYIARNLKKLLLNFYRSYIYILCTNYSSFYVRRR